MVVSLMWSTLVACRVGIRLDVPRGSRKLPPHRHKCRCGTPQACVTSALSSRSMTCRLCGLRLRQQHVCDDRYPDRAPMVVLKFHPAHADRRPDSHQMRPCQQPPLCDRPEVVDLQLDRGEPSHPIEMPLQSGTNHRIGDARRNASVQRALAVEQLGPDAALDRDAIAMQPHQFEPEQMIEGMPGQKFLDELVAAFGVAQVW